jgi:hypothetical protein
LEIQGFGRPAEHVPSAVTSRSLQRWLERCQAKQMKEKEKIVKEIITTQMADTVVLAKAISAEEDTEEAEDDAAEEETTIVSI